MSYKKREGDTKGDILEEISFRNLHVRKCKIKISFLMDNEKKKNVSMGKRKNGS